MSRRLSILFITLLLCLVFQAIAGNTAGQPAARPDRQIVQLTIAGPIGPATVGYIERVFKTIDPKRVELVIIRLDTPGGLDSSMRRIIKTIVNFPVPVVSFVSPRGARAASAGTYIMYASHIAAMSPGTNLGAATPVRLGGGSPAPKQGGKPASGSKKGKPAKPATGDAMKKKIINDAAAYIISLAKLHGRNHEWAEKAVREGVSLPADQALKMNVINIVANSVAELVQQLNGKKVKIAGKTRQLNTTGLVIKVIDPDWRSRFLGVITNPNIAYILLLIGIYGLILEFSNPGAIVPGTIGAIALILALYSLQLLPINYTGMALILLGIGLMVAEAFEPSFGILGIGGLTAFVIGSIILMDTKAPGFRINLSIIVSFALTSAVLFLYVIRLAFRARRRPVVSGMEQLDGAEAIVIDDFDQQGTVSIHGEIWRAETGSPLKKGQKVRVTQARGLLLTVEPEPGSQTDTRKPEEKS